MKAMENKDHTVDFTKMVTAVDWLVEKLNQCEPMYSGILSDEHKAYIDNLIEQAKQMEKKQIIQAYQAGDGDAYNQEENFGEHYYNETYA